MLERLAIRYPLLRTPVSVQRRFRELHGAYLAAAITLSAFLSLFPLLLVAMAVLGFISHGDPSLPRDTVRFLGLQGSPDAARLVTNAIGTAEEHRAGASIFGVIGLLWSGLGVVSALQYVLDSLWQVEGRGMKGKLAGLLWLLGAALLFGASFAVTSLVNALPGLLAPINLALGLALSFALFLWTMKVLSQRDVGWRPLLPGAAAGAVGLEILKVVGAVYVPRTVAASSALYGSIGIVFAVIAWLLIFGRLIVYSSLVNVVRWENDRAAAVAGDGIQ